MIFAEYQLTLQRRMDKRNAHNEAEKDFTDCHYDDS